MRKLGIFPLISSVVRKETTMSVPDQRHRLVVLKLYTLLTL